MGLEYFEDEDPLHNVDLTNIKNIVFGFSDYMGSAAVYIDTIKFE